MSLQVIDFYKQHIYQNQTREDLYIASLDPLAIDDIIKTLPKLNEQKDTIALVLMLVDMLPYTATAANFDCYQACAAMRDIGILLGSLKRHKVEPVNVIPDLEEKLNLLASKTSLPPRDTLLHYTVWNPQGERLRTYTGSADEKQLIESVRIAMQPLIMAIYYLKTLHVIPINLLEFNVICEQVLIYFSQMVKGVVHAKKNVSPHYFAQELRFYFDPIILNQREYLGPGAVEMPVFVFDHLLWGADCKDEAYVDFKYTYLPYIQNHVRDIFKEFEGKESLVTKLVNSLQGEPFNENVVLSAKALLKLFTMLKSFRMPHKKLADEAYAHSKMASDTPHSVSADKEARTKGSGGYSPQILDYILQLTLENNDKVESSLNAYIKKATIQASCAETASEKAYLR